MVSKIFLTRWFSILCFTTAVLVSQHAFSAQIPMTVDIRTDISTDFGLYQSYTVNVEPSVIPYQIENDFSNVANFEDFSFTMEEKKLLIRNGFLVSPSPYREMYDIYNQAKNDQLPIFVTVDALLHTYHELFDYILRTIETKQLIGDIESLSKALLESSQTQMSEAADPRVRSAAQKNVAYFTIATKLLDPSFPVPAEVTDMVNAEIELIQNHEQLTLSPLFGYMEDYTQYLPRGHYTLSEELSRYFRAMMWYGRMTFHAETGGFFNITQVQAEEATRRALLIVQSMNHLSVGNEAAMDLWNRVYQPTVFFVGKSDDLSVYEYSFLAREIYGEDFANKPADQYADPVLLRQMMNAVKNLEGPRIVPEMLRGFRFMGQRFIPDSYMFTELVYDRTDRYMPRGLDVMAVLGSQRAYEILDQHYHETDDPRYVSQMAALIEEFSNLNPKTWVQNLYWNWLYCLMPLLAEKGEGFPFYMQNVAWQDKELSCALGSWAELRHDTILYAKQSYTLRGGRPSFLYAMEFVEPNPWAFARLASLTHFMMAGLESQNLLLADFKDRLELLHTTLLSLKRSAEKIVSNQSLSTSGKHTIRTIGETLTTLTIFEEEDRIGDYLEDDMAVIADVHTDVSHGIQVLEVGVGRPLNLYVIEGSGDNLVIAVGSAFSYYEFVSPERLTDESWREMLDTDSAPELPDWMNTFIDLTNDTIPVQSTRNATFQKTVIKGSMNLTSIPNTPQQGETIILQVTIHDYSGSELFLEAAHGSKQTVIPLTPDESTPAANDYLATFDTTGWPEGEMQISVYNPSDVEVFYTSSIQLSRNTSSVGMWEFY